MKLFLLRDNVLLFSLFISNYLILLFLQVPLLLPLLLSAMCHVMRKTVEQIFTVLGMQGWNLKSPRTTACTGSQQRASKHNQNSISLSSDNFKVLVKMICLVWEKPSDFVLLLLACLVFQGSAYDQWDQF